MALFGGFIVTLTIVTLGKIFNFDSQQKKAFQNILKTKQAAYCITQAF